MATPAPIDKRSFDRQAADWIRNAIVSGELHPGSKVTEFAMAERIGLSRSTVRAAMQRLGTEGLLVQRAYAGWEVASLSRDDAWELYTLRCDLEGMAARLAAERLDDQGRQGLQQALVVLKRALDAKDDRAVAEADIDLHRAIVAASRHRRLAQQYAPIIDAVRVYVRWTNRESFDDLFPAHETLVKAILAGKASEAERLARRHMQQSCDQLLARFNAQSRQA